MNGVGATLLWVRAALLAAVLLGAGALAHVMADGRVPGPIGLTLIAVLTTAGCAAWLRRPASRGRIVLLTVAGQTWVHGVLTAAAGHRGDGVSPTHHAATAPTPAPTGTGGGSYFDVYAASRPDVADTAPSLPAPVLHVLADLNPEHAPMMLAHLAAAVVLGLWLASGEQALWALVAALAGATPVLALRPVAVPHPRLPLPDSPALPTVAAHLVSRCVVRRGPPLLVEA